MQRTLIRRVAALEAKTPTNEKTTIFVILVAVGNLKPSINHIECGREVWTRMDCETEDDFRDRASREVKRNEWGNAILIAKESNEKESDYAKH